ncbi:MAG: hypothetical protein HY760_08355 [Nitrospirae bacterium]|nr:hypothetical protein [Nitrospirota bacterium]
MKSAPQTAEVTKTYRREMPNTWWLKKSSYVIFMLRELSSVFVALYAVFLLIQLYGIAGGPERYDSVAAVFQSGWMILLHLVMGGFILLHMATWFKISGRIFGYGSLTPGTVTAANYAVWVVASIAVVVFLLKG